VRGEIVSDWKREKNQFTLRVKVPANTSAIVSLPTSRPEVIFESGRQAARAAGVRGVRPEGERSTVTIGGGEYVFVLKE
jgi:alpha-L-rhamnosidase